MQQRFNAVIAVLLFTSGAAYAASAEHGYANNEPAIEVIKWKEIYDALEHTLDECQDVANVLESIALKNS